MDVGIRELKTRLSEFVERAARGEVIRVTDRGKPKAILAPLPGRLRIEEGIAQGWVRKGAGRPPESVRRVKAPKSVREMISEDRGE
jgi:prevent-host-death family protein